MGKPKFIMGLHLGHDASVTIVANGSIVAHVLQERISRIRHDYGLDTETIYLALEEAGIKLDEVSRVAFTGTQLTPAIIRNKARIQVSLDFSKSRTYLHNSCSWEDFPVTLNSSDIYRTWLLKVLIHRGVDTSLYSTAQVFDVKDPLSVYFEGGLSSFSRVLNEIEEFCLPPKVSQRDLRFDVLLNIDGVEIPGSWWSHHIAHARSNLAIGQPGERVIVSIDGGEGALSGCVWFCSERGELSLITPHYLEVGRFYEFVASKLGLGLFGYSAGKLMGLAGYSISRARMSIPVGSALDWLNSNANSPNNSQTYEILFEKILESTFGDKKEFELWDRDVMDERAIQIAKIAQELVEDSLLTLSSAILTRFGKDIKLGVSGGVALNCPTNSLLNSIFPNQVIIEPHCDDGGLSIGSALLEEDDLMQESKNEVESSAYAFKGVTRREFDLDELIKANCLQEISTKNPYLEVAKRISGENAVVGIFSARSETGPRALGSRSILADARRRENWNLVNGVKQREAWRPFAPAILEEELEEWFFGGPRHSPFMLFNYFTRDEKRELIPAVVHFDGTSRVQTVDKECIPLRPILEAFYDETKVPVLLNTSFNGPGEPIVEFVENAVEMGKGSGLSYLLIFDKLFLLSR